MTDILRIGDTLVSVNLSGVMIALVIYIAFRFLLTALVGER